VQLATQVTCMPYNFLSTLTAGAQGLKMLQAQSSRKTELQTVPDFCTQFIPENL
jgi:hypothetical protein